MPRPVKAFSGERQRNESEYNKCKYMGAVRLDLPNSSLILLPRNSKKRNSKKREHSLWYKINEKLNSNSAACHLLDASFWARFVFFFNFISILIFLSLDFLSIC